MISTNTYFVSGIDTDCGKTYVTGVLAAAWRVEGLKVITQKFVQTGCGQATEEISEDILEHRRIMGVGPYAEDLDFTTCPYRFSYPASADLAARLDGREIDTEVIAQATGKLRDKYDVVLIEGAGGLMVPVRGKYTTLDYVVEKSLPLILVTSPRLGSINHTLLSLEAIRNRGVQLEMVVYNRFPVVDEVMLADTRRVIREYIDDYFPSCDFIEID